MSTIIGVDVSKNSIDTAFEKDTKKFVQGKFDNSSEGFCLFYDSLPKGDRITVMEATGPYYLKLAYFLHEKGEKIAVVNPLKIRRFAQMRFERIHPTAPVIVVHLGVDNFAPKKIWTKRDKCLSW
jgi:transposase